MFFEEMVLLGDSQPSGTDQRGGLHHKTALDRDSEMVQIQNQQWHLGGNQQLSPSRQSPDKRIPDDKESHHYDLPHRREV